MQKRFILKGLQIGNCRFCTNEALHTLLFTWKLTMSFICLSYDMRQMAKFLGLEVGCFERVRFLWGPFFFRFKVRIWFLDDVQFVALVTISEGPTYKGSKIFNFNGWEVTSARFWILSGFFFLTLWTALTQSLLVSISVVLMYISSTNVASLKIC